MEVTNIQEEKSQKLSVAWIVAKWSAVWLVIYGVMGFYGGLFKSAPQDIPGGMSWINPADAASSTFYILRSGPHLVLELNPHSQIWNGLLLTGLGVLFMWVCSRAVQGKLKNKRGELYSGGGQALAAVLAGGLSIGILTLGMGNLMQKETLDLDPTRDLVQLNGASIASFQQVSGFRSYITRGSKGGTYYHIVLQCSGQEPVPIGGTDAHSDVDQVAGYLNAYLTEVRHSVPPG